MPPLKPQDVLVVLKLCSIAARSPGERSRRPGMAVLGAELGMSSSEVHAAMRRCKDSGLLQSDAAVPPEESAPPLKMKGRPGSERPNVSAIEEFLVHGLKYAFPPRRGEPTRGVPTSYGAPPLDKIIRAGADPVPVWPWAEGKVRGVSFEPLYRTVPFAALQDVELYELLALTDALRDGRARERKTAADLLKKRLSGIHHG
jgi:hypothetical protein